MRSTGLRFGAGRRGEKWWGRQQTIYKTNCSIVNNDDKSETILTLKHVCMQLEEEEEGEEYADESICMM